MSENGSDVRKQLRRQKTAQMPENAQMSERSSGVETCLRCHKMTLRFPKTGLLFIWLVCCTLLSLLCIAQCVMSVT